ncbi:flagellar brake protein [Ferriphaselus sp. R-1]|uniref:flagellar brake protein n=1 Tax=Ferriphaselus sp. R-1 TaxID=1485544 RepID=UPI00068A8AC2|nr:flagellar brake protein [Ferriphaselus sp. R-1]
MDNTNDEQAVLALEQVRLHIGDMVQLQFQAATGDTRHYVTLIGYLKGGSVIVSTPVEAGKVMLVREGVPVVVRFFGGKNAYAFSAEIRRVTNVPFPHLHLSFPKEVRGMVVRSSSRTSVSLIGSAVDATGKRYACQVRDISMGGALLVAKEQMAGIDEYLGLGLRVKVNGHDYILEIECQLRSCHADARAEADPSSQMHGVRFTSLSAEDTLVLTALLYNSLSGQADIL